MIAFTLLMGLSLTSCMGESDPTVTSTAFGKITSSFPTVIDTPMGIKFNAVNALEGQDLFPGDYVYFQYSYNSDEQKIDRNTKSIDATIIIGEKVTYRPSTVDVNNGEGEPYENATVLLIGNGPDSQLKFYYYDKSKLIVPIIFLSKDGANGHDFTLVYNETEVKEGDSEIVFYLRQKSSDTEAKKPTLSYKLFDIDRPLELFTAAAGSKPRKVVICANETKDETSDSLDKKKEQLTKYIVEYNFEDK